jgi:TatD DNase family protein
MLFDSHCHLTDEKFASDLPEVLRRARDHGVERIVCIASDLQDSRHVATLVNGEEDVWGTAGIHPHDAASAAPGAVDEVRELARSHPRIVAIGETGLDFYYDNSPRREQIDLFQEHVALARELDLPLVVHSRSADEETGRVISEAGEGVRGVLHCFSGGPALLEWALDLDWYISFAGVVSFKKFDGQESVRRVPQERLLIETDAPYLAPVPKRGKRNEPAFVSYVCDAIALIRDESPDTVAAYTTENALRFYGLPA